MPLSGVAVCKPLQGGNNDVEIVVIILNVCGKFKTVPTVEYEEIINCTT